MTISNLDKILFLLTTAVFLSACCKDVVKEDFNISRKENKPITPTSIAVNKSIVTAKLEDVLSGDNGIFIIGALLTKVEENPAYSSLAMANKIYFLIPNFQLDENKNLVTDSKKNQDLLWLVKQNIGYEFKAVIFFENLNGWFIEEVINN